MRRIHIHAEAAEEVAAAAGWYEREHPGLGLEFEQAVEAALDLLEEDLVPLVPRRMPESDDLRWAGIAT